MSNDDPFRLLIVDEQPSIRNLCAAIGCRTGLRCLQAASVAAVVPAAKANGTASATGALVSGDFAAYANAVWYFYATIDNVNSHAYNAGGITAFAHTGAGIATVK